MKQRITVEQLAELTDDQKQRLRDWWKPEVGEHAAQCGIAYDGKPYMSEFRIDRIDQQPYFILGEWEPDLWEPDYFWHAYSESLPLLSIGQLLEIFDMFGREKKCWWEVMVGWRQRDIGELCDRLWEAVRIVL